MTAELKEPGLPVGERRAGRLMKDNGSLIDLYSRPVIGWAVSDRMKRDLAIRARQMAINLRQPPPGCIHHTDRGSQYCSHDDQKLLRGHHFEVSMSGKGNCFDNAAVERRGFTRTGGLHPLHLQDPQGRTDLAPKLGNKTAARTGLV